MSEFSEITFPEHVLVDPDKETRSLFVDRRQHLIAGGNIVQSFATVDQRYQADKQAYYEKLEKSVARLQMSEGPIDAGFLVDNDIESEDISLVFSPLNDGRPMSGADDIYRYTLSDHSPEDKRKAQPNSWGPIMKLAISRDFQDAEGRAMPHLQLFAREVPALSRTEKRQIASGITLPYGRLAIEALQTADRLRQSLTDQGGFKRVHLFAAGMGSKALGAAVHMMESSDEHEIASVTVQNLSIGEASASDLLGKYMTRRMVGDVSLQQLPKTYRPIPEPLARREVDDFGAEAAMRRRNIRALMNWRVARGVMGTEMPARYIEQLLDSDVTLTVANPLNEAMNVNTERYLPVGATGRFHYTQIVGVEGKKVGQGVNEQAGLIAVVASLGVGNYFRDQEAT